MESDLVDIARIVRCWHIDNSWLTRDVLALELRVAHRRKALIAELRLILVEPADLVVFVEELQIVCWCHRKAMFEASLEMLPAGRRRPPVRGLFGRPFIPVAFVD